VASWAGPWLRERKESGGWAVEVGPDGICGTKSPIHSIEIEKLVLQCFFLFFIHIHVIYYVYNFFVKNFGYSS
jgi:hypothetical protein